MPAKRSSRGNRLDGDSHGDAVDVVLAHRCFEDVQPVLIREERVGGEPADAITKPALLCDGLKAHPPMVGPAGVHPDELSRELVRRRARINSGERKHSVLRLALIELGARPVQNVQSAREQLDEVACGRASSSPCRLQTLAEPFGGSGGRDQPVQVLDSRE